jgi:hypothetical protein
MARKMRLIFSAREAIYFIARAGQAFSRFASRFA